MLKVYVDVATKNAKGLTCAGIMWVENGVTTTFQIPLGLMTNHEGEFLAVIHALKELLKAGKENQWLILYTDSLLVVNTLEKKHTSHPLYQEFLTRLLFLTKKFTHLNIQFQKDNKHKGAHTLATQGLRKMEKEEKS